jgi:hypothetical protein
MALSVRSIPSVSVNALGPSMGELAPMLAKPPDLPGCTSTRMIRNAQSQDEDNAKNNEQDIEHGSEKLTLSDSNRSRF